MFYTPLEHQTQIEVVNWHIKSIGKKKKNFIFKFRLLCSSNLTVLNN